MFLFGVVHTGVRELMGLSLSWATVIVMVAGICLMLIPHLPLDRLRPSKSLSSMREPGECLLREVRQPQTTATNAQVDEFMERGNAWDKEVASIFIANDDRDRLREWTGVQLWYLGRPQAGDQGEVEDLLERPLTKRLRMLEDFCRELSCSDSPQ